MTRIPGSYSTAFELNLADRAEAVVGDDATFFDKIEANLPQFFFKCDKIECD
jgi:hypothetical protein